MAGGIGGAGLSKSRSFPFLAGRRDVEETVAWLLRANRVYGHDQKWASLTAFAAAFRGGGWPHRVSPSQVSRWETASARAGIGVLRRYEELLELPPGRLVATADWIYRKTSRRTGPPALDRGLDPADPRVADRAGELLEQALSADLMTGLDWDELTCHLAAFPVTFVHPATAWADLAERLLAELIITDGLAWLLRIEAVARLLGHPRARPPLIAACAAMAADPACQVIIEPLAILADTAEADANRYVMAQLANPASDRAQRGALLAAVEKIPLRHFRPRQLRALIGVAADLLTAADLSGEAGVLAAELLRLAPATELGTAAEQRLRHAADATTRAVLAHGRTAVPDAAGQVTDRVTAATAAKLPTPRQAGPHPDPLLSRLVDELLFSPNQNRRLLAGLVAAATPYRDRLGAAVAAELATAPAARAVPLTSALLAAMPIVGRAADRPLVERFAVATGLPAAVTDTAAWVIGHVPGQSSRRFWLAGVDAHARAWQRSHNPASVSALRGLTYAMGIGRQHDLLRTVRASTELPAPVRTAAGWWLGIPRRVHASAAN